MSAIDPTAHLTALIRSRISSVNKTAAQSKPAAALKSRQSARRGSDIAGLVAERAGIIDPDDPQRERKAFRIFLESVFVAELGIALTADPAFHAMVDEVQRQMESDPELAVSMQQASQRLLNAKAGK